MGEGGGCVVTLAEGRIIGARVESCQCALSLSFFFGKGPATKSNEFSEKFQTALDPPHFRKIILQTVYIDMVAYMRGGMLAR